MRLQLILSLAAMFCSCQVLSFTIAVVGKTKNDSFYEQSFHGCLEFAKSKQNVRCIYDGSIDYQDVRTQVLVVKELIERNVDALLISTSDSDFLVKGALQKAKTLNIPVVTFDSDLLPQDAEYRLAYVGTNNFDFGVALGNKAMLYKTKTPQPICIQTGHPTTPNLNERIEGVRFALSGQRSQRLDGSSGWIEHDRCPLYTLGKRDLALNQLITILGEETSPIFIAVAGFAQFNPQYSEKISPFKTKIANQKNIILSADTEQGQLQILKRGLSTANIGQNPFEMGRKGAELLYEWHIQKNKPAQDKFFLNFHHCTQDNVEECLSNQ